MQEAGLVIRTLERNDNKIMTITKSYHLIALMNCLGKVLFSCITKTLEYKIERLGLLLNHHSSSHAGHTTTDSLHLITTKVHNAWQARKVASILFLDIEAAFPSAILECLFHEMRCLGVPEVVVSWLHRKLSGQQTHLLFDDFTLHIFEILSSIDQGII